MLQFDNVVLSGANAEQTTINQTCLCQSFVFQKLEGENDETEMERPPEVKHDLFAFYSTS